MNFILKHYLMFLVSLLINKYKILIFLDKMPSKPDKFLKKLRKFSKTIHHRIKKFIK